MIKAIESILVKQQACLDKALKYADAYQARIAYLEEAFSSSKQEEETHLVTLWRLHKVAAKWKFLDLQDEEDGKVSSPSLSLCIMSSLKL